MNGFRSAQANVFVHVPPEAAFALLDDHARLSGHMEKRSAMMLGSSMRYEVDRLGFRAVGSILRFEGRVACWHLFAEEEVVEREPPFRKVWQTRGTPRLLLIGPYRMGFGIRPAETGSLIRVFLEYRLPEGLAACVGFVLAPAYARWCVQRMARVVARAVPST